MDDLVRRVEQVMREVQPSTLYAFHAGEAHRDHRALLAVLLGGFVVIVGKHRRTRPNFLPPHGRKLRETVLRANLSLGEIGQRLAEDLGEGGKEIIEGE